MEEEDWQKLADKDVKPAAPRPVAAAAAVNRWDGEDEDDDIKDSWDADDDDEKKDQEKIGPPPVPKAKMTLGKKIEIKEKQRLEREEKKRKEREEEEMAHLTPEQRAVEILRLKKIQEEADLVLGLETLGLTPTTTLGSSIESFNPSSKEDFTEYAEAISKTVSQYRTKAEYSSFVEDLVRNLCAGLSSTNIKKVKNSLDNLYVEKQKIEKGDKPKKKPAAKVKATLRMEGDDDYNSRVGAYEADDYDDFM